MTAVESAPPAPRVCARTTESWVVPEYHLEATLSSGQTFRWRRVGAGMGGEAGDVWEGVVLGRWVRLRQSGARLEAELATPVSDWRWLEDYLQLHVDLRSVTCHWPADGPLRA